MTTRDSSLRTTFQLIVDILNPESDEAILKNTVTHTNVNWESVVVVGSQHLVLPAILCRLQQKQLLKYLPQDLVLYLNELTDLNRERNKQLLEEAAEISTLFSENDISHVFLKGIALLAGNYFKDLGERMIGDIDILVAEDDLESAFKLLNSYGYERTITFNYDVKDHRHKPRQISDKHLGAVELHSTILKEPYNRLIDKESFFLTKKIKNNLFIPTTEQLIYNAILAHQINDHKQYYNSIHLKTIFDVMVLGLFKQEVLLKRLLKNHYFSSFLNLSSVFNLTHETNKGFNSYLNKKIYSFTLEFPKLGKRWYRFKSLYLNIAERVHLVLNNKSYRKHIIKNKLNS